MEQQNSTKDTRVRHVCLSGWLISLMVCYAMASLVYILIPTYQIMDWVANHQLESWMIISTKILGLLNVLFCALIYIWKNWGFLAYWCSSLFMFGLSHHLGMNTFYSVIFLLGGVLILSAILFVEEEKTGKSAYDHLFGS